HPGTHTRRLLMNCVVCGTEVPYRPAEQGGMHPWCSDECGGRWRTLNNLLFHLNKRTTITGEQVLGLVMQRGHLDDSVRTLTRLSQVSTTLRPLAKEHELGDAFHKKGLHQQQQGTKTEVSYKISQQKTGKKISVEKLTKAGKPYRITVDETKEVKTKVEKQVPNIVKVAITADTMLEIALMAYNTAVGLK